MSFTKHLLRDLNVMKDVGTYTSPPLLALLTAQNLASKLQTPNKPTPSAMPSTMQTQTQMGANIQPDTSQPVLPDASTQPQPMTSGTVMGQPSMPGVDREKPQLRINPATGQSIVSGTPGAKPLAEQNIPGHNANKALHVSYDQPHNIVMHLTNTDYAAVNASSDPNEVANTAAQQVIKGVKESGVKIDPDVQKAFLQNITQDSGEWYHAQIQSGMTPSLTDYYIFLAQKLNYGQLAKDGNLTDAMAGGYNPDYIQAARAAQVQTTQDVRSKVSDTSGKATPYDPKLFANATAYDIYRRWAAVQPDGTDISFENFMRQHPNF